MPNSSNPRADLVIEKIIDSARRSCGMSSSSSWFRRRVIKLMSKAVSHGRAYRFVTAILSISAVIVPFILSQLISALHDSQKLLAIIVAITIMIALILTNFFMPKALADNAADADNLKFEFLVNRLAGQIALHNMIQKIPTDEDHQTLQRFSRAIDPAITATFSGREESIRGIIRNCPRWKDGMLSVGDLGLAADLDQQLSKIAESIAQVSRIIFSANHCTVKIYLRTTHNMVRPDNSVEEVRLLTSVARFPPKDKGYGKSWLECDGKDADVWQAFRRKDVLVFQHVKSATEKKTYPTIACLPLPDDLGVISIEANDSCTFMPLGARDEPIGTPTESEFRMPVPDHIIDEDLRQSLTLSVKELVLKAIRAAIPEPGSVV